MDKKECKKEISQIRLDVSQTARRLKISRQSVYRLIHSGELRAAAFGPVKGLQVWESSVDAYERERSEQLSCL